jgi:hypothetical protein
MATTLTDNSNKVWDVVETGAEKKVAGGVATVYLVRERPANPEQAGAAWLGWAVMVRGKKDDGTDIVRLFPQEEAAARAMFGKNK